MIARSTTFEMRRNSHRAPARVTGAIAAAVACAMLGGCALFRGPAPARTLSLDLPVSRTEAVRRTLSVFREEGYTVRSTLTSGSQPETEPFREGDAEAVFRASITGSARASQVVLSGTYRRVKLAGLMHGKEEEVRNTDDPLEHRLWNRLDQLRLALREAMR